jgi:inner membrane protein
MPFSHPVATLVLAAPFYRRDIPARIWVAGAILTALPDIDFVGYQMGVPYPHLMGHRGFTHSLFFAAVVGLLCAVYLRRDWPLKFATLWLFFFLCTASHGFLDGMTNGGLGVAYFSPFDEGRYWLPFRPIPVAPLGPRLIFSEWGARVMARELVWVWLPIFALTAAIIAARWRSLRT